jgi:hypothetical protein
MNTCATKNCHNDATRLVIYHDGDRVYMCAECLERIRPFVGHRIRLVKALQTEVYHDRP